MLREGHLPQMLKWSPLDPSVQHIYYENIKTKIYSCSISIPGNRVKVFNSCFWHDQVKKDGDDIDR